MVLGGLSLGSEAVGPNILLVTIDTLRADRVGAYGYRAGSTPSLDRLAARGVRFADAVAHVPLTYPSHVSILTGRYAGSFGVRLNGTPVLDTAAVTLAESLSAAGYKTGAFIGSTVLDGATGLDQGFDVYDDDFETPVGEQVALSELQRPAGQVVAAAERWLSGQAGPWFAWVHLYDPHLPYSAPAEFQKASPGRPYDAEVSYADAMVGRLLTRLDRTNTVVVVVSDHGEALGDHGELDHGFFIYDSTLNVPLIVAGPGISPRVVKEQVRLVDVMPTILALAGDGGAPFDSAATAGLAQGRNAPPLHPPFDGVSVLPLINGQTRPDVPPSLAETWYPRLHFGWSELRGVRVGEFMYIAAPKPELYDLRTDPSEQTNIVDRRAPVAARLAAELALISKESAPNDGGAQAPPRQPQPDPETVRRLQALGYVGSFAPVTAGTGEDPKDHVSDYRTYRELLNRSLGALERGQPAAAVPLLQKLVKLNVRAFEAHLYLGNAYAGTGRLEAALGEYDAALQLNPEVTAPRFEKAKVLLQNGQADRAIAEARAALAREPRSAYGWYTLGVIHQKSGQAAEAYRAFEEAVRLNPRDRRATANLADAALRTGQTAVARAQFERMIALGYRAAPAHYNLGLIAERSGDPASARAHFQAALKADPKFGLARDALNRLK